MKVAICYPPLEDERGTPLLSQNRQFQWFSEPTYIYPVIPAYAATLLKEHGHEVIWDDGIAEELHYDKWLARAETNSPDIVAIETKTPVVKRHWRTIRDIKKRLPETKVVLMGDHVTALPEESFKNTEVDYVVTGGDYDFLLLNLVEHLSGKQKIEPGIWYKTEDGIRNSGHFVLNHNLNELPLIDRDLTKWRLYSQKNGNFKRRPGTYTMAGRDCWWHRCAFCSWTTLYPTWRCRSPTNVVEEIGMLIDKYGIKEVFDDTGTFPVGNWLKRFCDLMIEKKYNREIYFSCNMRFGALSFQEYVMMKHAGFRELLFGLESANQETLNRLNKNLVVEEIERSCRKAREAGLEPHLTIMIGYPWETREHISRTLRFAKKLMEKGWAVTLQATIVIPYPGTPLYEESRANGWFRIDPSDYERYDMKYPILTTSDMSPEEVTKVCNEMYKLFISPKYILRHLRRIRSWSDLKFSLYGLRKVMGHVRDFDRD